MKRMRDEFGITFIFSTHDPRIMDQADTFFHMEDGRLKQDSGPASEGPASLWYAAAIAPEKTGGNV
jgi:ABC-type lipoprotein export system ATPase subunit